MTPLDEYRSSVTEVRLIQEIQRRHRDQRKVNALNRATVVLLLSHFESFLKAIAEEYVDALGDGSRLSRDIPPELRELYTTPRLEEIVRSGDTQQRRSLLKKSSEWVCLWNDEARPSKGTLKAEILVAQVTSARPEKVDQLFSLMGRRKSVCDGDLDVPDESGSHPVDIRFSLDDLVKCRNDIAHGDADRKPTDEDVRRYVDFLDAFASRLYSRASEILSQYTT